MTTTIDEALELLEGTGPEFAGGLSNHGPMAAEALFALGRGESAIPWAERYKRRLTEHPEARSPIARDDWPEALGDGRRVGDWIAFFERELAEAPWQSVLGVWAPRLAPGLVAAATHGVIRTGHAVRSLSAGETRQRVQELAEGLGYWASRYQRLPGAMGESRRLTPSAAIGRVEPVAGDQQQSGGLITQGLRRLDEHAPFGDTINLVDTSGDVSTFVSDMTETFAHVYLANAGSGLVIHFIHAVTGPRAVRLLAPYLSAGDAADALRYAWQAGAALYAAFGRGPGGAAAEAPAGDADELIDRAVATGDEHAIKFTEACLREQQLNPKPVYLAAAWDAVQRLSRS
jgi:hypothetical protein